MNNLLAALDLTFVIIFTKLVFIALEERESKKVVSYSLILTLNIYLFLTKD
jgi:hypothetical protein